MKTLFPDPQRPYIIVTPPYNEISSGVKTLHLLSHGLNSVGQKAYITLYGEPIHPPVNPDLNTPLVTPNIYAGDPIVVYPDHITGNPLQAKNVVRYLLARPGQYAEWKPEPTDRIWCNSTGMAKEMGHDRVLKIPCTDIRIFHPPKIDLTSVPKRELTCYYAHKYDKIHGNQLLDITKDSIRLEGTPQQLAEILRKSKVCYVYEPSNIIFDATLCGCPVVLLKTDYFNELHTQEDWGMYGVRWSDTPDVPMNPNEDIFWWRQVKEDHMAAIAIFWEQLDRFIKETKDAKSI